MTKIEQKKEEEKQNLDSFSESEDELEWVDEKTINKEIIYSKSDKTIEKICIFLEKINNLEKRIDIITTDRDKLEEKLRMTLLNLNNKILENKIKDKEISELKEENKKFRERILNIRSKALKRKKQVYILAVLILISIVENIYHGFLYKFTTKLLIPSIKTILSTTDYEVIFIRNIILTILIIYYVCQKPWM
jgi:hypothetical protein